ncbi:hypothetical protein GOP47_0018243 [Adiantum capillus-veneris]|uniref:Uncharacterized protein n=1 Tax=Adiantum capillus-veneris TaxID=13818 RepID=A0A9D4UGZ9_ADICA|nr:hypothetical protein GOP47_0018243 [Adiantum capillus-veneris]
MAMASLGARIVPETSMKLMGGLNLTVTPEDCEESNYGAWSVDGKGEQPPSAYGSFSSAVNKAESDQTSYNVDLISDSSSSAASWCKGKLSVLLEEGESLSHGEGSSSSSLSIASSSASSSHAFFRRHKNKERESWKHHRQRRDGNKESFMSVLLWPLKKLRDGYMSCMMGLDGAGDLSGLAQGSTFATSTKYFTSASISKTDMKNYG